MSHGIAAHESDVQNVSLVGEEASNISVGLLGSHEKYNLPRRALTAMCSHLGGEAIGALPPFLLACLDGIAIVLTLRVGFDYMGGAIFLPWGALERLDHALLLLWERAEKEQTATDFFSGTAFRIADQAGAVPPSVEAGWRPAFC